MSFRHLDVPPHWQHHWSRYPEGYTILEALLNWVNQVDNLVDNVNDWNTYLDQFVKTYDKELQGTVEATLTEWQQDGTLNVVINNALNLKMGGIIDAREFGATGDGVTDDTAAIQNMLDSTNSRVGLRNGAYLVTQELTSSLANRSIITEGAVILAGTQEMTVLTVTGENTHLKLDIDGQDLAAIGINVKAAKSRAIGSSVKNLRATSGNAVGIKVESTGGAILSHNKVKNIFSAANGTIGDHIGASRGIYVTATAAATEETLIYNNTIDNITGEEGDGIQVLFFDGTYPFLSAKTTVKDNTVNNVSRRAIKIQGSDCKVKHNKHRNTLSTANVPNPANLIDILSSDNVEVTHNEVEAQLFLGIKASGSSTTKAKGVIVKENIVHGASDKMGLYFEHLVDSEIDNNTFYDGSNAIAGAHSLDTSISGNTIYGGDGTKPGINLVSNNNRLTVNNNKGPSGNRTYLIANVSPNALVMGNSGNCSTDLIMSSSASSGSCYKDNINRGSGLPVTPDTYLDQQFIGNISM